MRMRPRKSPAVWWADRSARSFTCSSGIRNSDRWRCHSRYRRKADRQGIIFWRAMVCTAKLAISSAGSSRLDSSICCVVGMLLREINRFRQCGKNSPVFGQYSSAQLTNVSAVNRMLLFHPFCSHSSRSICPAPDDGVSGCTSPQFIPTAGSFLSARQKMTPERQTYVALASAPLAIRATSRVRCHISTASAYENVCAFSRADWSSGPSKSCASEMWFRPSTT